MSDAAPFPPPLVRPKAYAIICRGLGYWPAMHTRLADLCVSQLADVLIALEGAFGVELEVDAALKRQTVLGLIDLVDDAVHGAPRPPSAQVVDLAAYRAQRRAKLQKV